MKVRFPAFLTIPVLRLKTFIVHIILHIKLIKAEYTRSITRSRTVILKLIIFLWNIVNFFLQSCLISRNIVKINLR